MVSGILQLVRKYLAHLNGRKDIDAGSLSVSLADQLQVMLRKTHEKPEPLVCWQSVQWQIVWSVDQDVR